MMEGGKMKIGVAIATYNGEKYIEQQLDSILSQTRKPDIVVISDDKSTDETIEKIESIRSKTTTPIVIIQNERRLGVFDNFMQAFLRCDTDYIAYCDQDDVWRQDKLEQCDQILRRDPTISLLFHKSEIVDSQLRKIGVSQPHNIRPGLYKFPHIPQTLWGFGHQMIFSNDTLKVMLAIRSNNSESMGNISANYDKLLLVSAGAAGSIYHLGEDLTKFRRHDNTVSPAAKETPSESIALTRLCAVKEIACLTDSLISFSKAYMATRPDVLEVYLKNAKRVAQSNKMRQAIYEDPRAPIRLLNLVGALVNGAYGRENINKLPPRAAAIDFLYAIGLRLGK